MVITFNDWIFWLFVMMRLTGMVFFNNLIGRTNIPTIFRVGLVVVLAYFVTGMIEAPLLHYQTWIGVSLALVKELLIGFFMGYLISAVLSIFMVAGELLDMQMGIAMAKMYDPQSNVSMPIFGMIFNAMFLLLFFLSNAYLNLFEIMVYSFRTIPLGVVAFSSEMPSYAVMFFGNVLVLALKMALPMIVIQLLAEVGIGIIMKAIPQINVFVLNIEMKMIVGYFVIFVLVPGFSEYVNYIMQVLMSNISVSLGTMFS